MAFSPWSGSGHAHRITFLPDVLVRNDRREIRVADRRGRHVVTVPSPYPPAVIQMSLLSPPPIGRPRLGDIRSRAQRDGVAFFMPAYHEAANLRVLVPRTVDYFRRLACPFTVIIVDDGSTRDDTYETAERLAQAFPGQVQAIHHPQNKGYGAALRSGIRGALRTGHRLIAFCDADGQFDIQSFGTL